MTSPSDDAAHEEAAETDEVQALISSLVRHRSPPGAAPVLARGLCGRLVAESLARRAAASLRSGGAGTAGGPRLVVMTAAILEVVGLERGAVNCL